MGWFRSLFRRQEREQQLDAELRFHLDELIREKTAAGMSPEQARREAALEFGGVEQVKEECRDGVGAVWIDALVQDVKFCLRSLGKSPGFTFTAIATIAIGIGANAAIFSYIDGLILRPVEYPDADRMISLSETRPDGTRDLATTLNYLAWEKNGSAFESITPHRWGSVALTGLGIPTQVNCERVGVHFFDIFRVPPLLGRLFLPGDDEKGRDHVAIINYAFWQAQFAGDPKIVGKTLRLDGEPYTVIGVLPKGVTDLTPAKIWRPLAFTDGERTSDYRWLLVWAKLKPGISLEQARAQMDTMARRMARDYPAMNRGWGIRVEPVTGNLLKDDVKQSLLLLMASVAMVLLIACVNLANLTLARSAVREREFAVRAALGAGRARLIRQLLTESLLLSVGGSVCGIGIAYAGLAGLNRLVPDSYIPPTKHVELDGRVLLFIAAVAILTALVFGLYPALKGSRPDLRGALNQGGSGASSDRSQQRFRGTLVILEVAMAVILLFGSGLLLRSFAKLKQVETGFDSTNVIAAGLPIFPNRFASAREFQIYLRRIEERMAAIPGVHDVAFANSIPMRGIGYGFPLQVAGRKPDAAANRAGCYFKIVSPSYFRLLHTRLVQGRLLDDHDVAGAAPAAVINATLAKQYFPGGNPLGQQLILPRLHFWGAPEMPKEATWQIVGVIADEQLAGLGVENARYPGVYVTNDQCPQPYQGLIVKSAGDPRLIQRMIPLALMEVDETQTLQNLTTLDQIKADSIGKQRLDSVVLGIFAGIALLLSALGLYGVISYSVAQRTREIGIRAALGASPSAILWSTLRSALILTGTGVALGIAGSVLIGRILASMLFHVEKYDPATLGTIVGIQAVIALLACLLPARRAIRVDPIIALRCE